MLGGELAGTVAEVGPGVGHLSPGDRIMSISRNFGAMAEQCVIDAMVSHHSECAGLSQIMFCHI